MQELERKAGESAQAWYSRLNGLADTISKLKVEAKALASVEVNLAEMKRRAKRDGLPIALAIGRSNLAPAAMKAVLAAAEAEAPEGGAE